MHIDNIFFINKGPLALEGSFFPLEMGSSCVAQPDLELVIWPKVSPQ